MAGIFSRMVDSLSAVAMGLVGGRAPGNGGGFVQLRTQQEIEGVYRTSWLAKKIHNLPPYDMTRAWRAWQLDKKDITAVEAEERRLGLVHKTRRALTLARLHGGGALILGLPGNSETEVTPETVSKGQLGYVHAVSRHQVQVHDLERDAASPYFGQPKFYEMTRPGATNLRLHPSRVIPFHGELVPEGAIGLTVDDFWGDPLLLSLMSALEGSESAQAAIVDLLKEAKVDVITIPNLMEMVGTADYETRLLKRLTLAQTIKSTTNALLISGPAGEGDQGEKWETKQLTFTGLPDLARMFLQVACGGADIPATRLLGQSPDGMNATGDSDLRNYYDMLAGKQSSDLQPALDPIDEMLLRSSLGTRPPEAFYEWRSLWQLSPETRAEVAKKKAETTKIYADTGLIPTRALEEGAQNQLIEDGTYPGLEDALDSLPEDERFPSENPDNDNEPAPDDMRVGPLDPAKPLAGAPPRRRAANDQAFTDAQPRTLYVSRKVTNAAAILKHFADQGVENLHNAADLHVTIAYSRTPIDWMTIAAEWSREPNGGITIPAGGPRIVEPLGADRVLVQLFNSLDLSWRHKDILRAGASWDFAEYSPHVTIADAQADGFEFDKLKPWVGVIELGPEIFEEVIEDWQTGATES